MTYQRLLTLKEVSERTRIPENTLRYWVHGRIELGALHGKLGKRLFWKEAEVDAWIEAKFNEEK